MADCAPVRVSGGLSPIAASGSASDLSSGTVPDARLADTAVTPGSYTSADITVDGKGRITAASSGTGGGDALTSGTLAQFAATTSAQLAGVISDETGSGALVFATSPALVTPALGTPTALVGTNITGTAAGLTAGSVTVADAGGDTTTWPMLATSQTGGLAPATDAGLTYNAATNALAAATFVGALAGNADTVTTNANLTGDVTSIGNAATLAASGVSAGSYMSADITVDAKGRVTAASSGTGGGTAGLHPFLLMGG